MARPGVVKIAVYTDRILIPFLFHIFRFQVSGVRNDEQRHWHLTPETRLAGRNKYGIFFKAILWAILIIPGKTYALNGYVINIRVPFMGRD